MTDTPEEARRKRLIVHFEEALATRARDAVYTHNLSHTSVVGICIDATSRWRALAERLCPNHDWQSFLDRGETPVVCGIVGAQICGIIRGAHPDMEHLLLVPPPQGCVKGIALDDHGCTIFHIHFARFARRKMH